jgi:phage FluMu protein Com
MKITPTRANDIRCPACNALLARREGGVIAIRRNDLQVSFAGDGHASVLCYRPSCRKLTVIATKERSTGPAG